MIKIMRVASVVVFIIALFLVITSSVMMFYQGFMTGFVYMLAGICAVLFYAGFIFIFLNMAEDIKYIKNKINEKEKDL